MSAPCELLKSQLSLLYDCIEKNGYIQVRTPFLYPDGDIIDLYVKEKNGVYSVTDFGETLRWLSSNTISRKRTEKQNAIIDDICLTHGIEPYKGMLTARANSSFELGNAVLRCSQAALRVSDLWFTFRTRNITSMNDDVKDLLTEKKIDYEYRPKIRGRHKIWNPDFHTHTLEATSLVYVLSTGSRGVAQELINRTVTAWHDLSHLKIGQGFTHFISLFDDTLDIWHENDFNLVGELSDVVFWSNTDQFEELLRKAA